jgi:hypothetical protein
MVPGRSASFANWYPGVRAIVASGYSNAPVFSDPESFGFSGVLPKPLMLGELERVVSEVLAMDSPSESSDRPDHASRSRR